MNKGTFGDQLKREREMRGVSLDEISAATRISTRFLSALENEQWDQLPGGVFNRGFVRAVARYLGLDEEAIVAEYALVTGDRPSVPVWSGSPPAVAPQQPWLAWAVIGAIVVVLAAGAWFGWRRFSAWRAARRAPHATALTGSHNAIRENSALAPATEKAVVPQTDPVAKSARDAAAQGAGAPDSASMTLKIEAGKATRVTVESDGESVFDDVMSAGENRMFHAKDKIRVSALDSGALLLELNGETLAPLGPPGQAGEVTLTRDARKTNIGGRD